MGASKKVLIVEGGEGGYSENVSADNALFVGGKIAEHKVPVARADGTVEWDDPSVTTVAAGDVSVDSSGFTENLSSADDDVQKALETIDQLDLEFSMWEHDGASGVKPRDDKYVDVNYVKDAVIAPQTHESGVIAIFGEEDSQEIQGGPSLIPKFVAIPASSSSPGIKGQEAANGNYYYKCTAANTWVRFAVETVF